MSIIVYLSRRAHPLDEREAPISASEWELAISAEPDFQSLAGPEPSAERPLARLWTGHPRLAIRMAWLDGNVEVRNPDRPTIARMVALAATLRARVFSETGEVFDAQGVSAGFLEGYP